MNKSIGLKVSILSISFLLMTRLTISPALAEIGKAFPAVSQESLMMMIVIPSLVGIIFGLLGGILAGFVRAKTLLYIGLMGYLIGGLGPVFVNDYNILILFRVLLGAGTGLFLPFASGLIASFFRGYERDQMFGLQSTAVGVGNIITSILAGVLAAMFWKLSFLIYSFGFLTLLLVIMYLPEPEKEEGVKSHMTTAMYFNPRVLWVCFTMLLYAILYFSFFGYLAFVIDGHNFGDAKAAGFATMLMTLASLLMGTVFGRLMRMLKRFSLTFSLILSMLGYYILASATGIGMIFAGSIVLGLGFGYLMPYSVFLLNEYSDSAAINYSNALWMVAVNIGTALGPKILVTVGAVAHNPDGQFIFLFSACCVAVATVVSFVWMFVPQKSVVNLMSE